MSNQRQHKLAQYEVAPPAGTWDAIMDALEHQSSAGAGKLQSYEAAPQSHLWQHIEEELDADQETQPKRIPLYRRLAQPLRYGSAAAILVLVAVATTLLLQKNTGS